MTGLAPSVRDRLAELGRVRALRRGERLVHEGSSGGAVILVLSGTLRVTRIVGAEEVVLAIRGPGDLIGELGPLAGRAALASVEARESGRVVVMASSRFMAAQQSDPALASAIADRLVELLVEADRRLANAQCKALVARISEEILLLAALAEPGGGRSSDRPAAVSVTQAELASLCVASRSSVAEAMGELRARALIETGRGRVVIRDHAGLRRLAETGEPVG